MEIRDTYKAASPETLGIQAGSSPSPTASGKKDWSAPTLTRLSGKETEGKTWYSPIEFMGWSAPS